MTNEEFIFGLLMEAESLGIRKEVLDLSAKIKRENKLIDVNTSIEKAFYYMKSRLEDYKTYEQFKN
jgi:hypothetical protein